jgi:hypothetical protein
MACSFHGLCGGLSCKELAFEVDVDEAVEFRRVDLEKRLRREDTGVVEEYVQATEPIDRRFHNSFASCWMSNVANMNEDA